MGLLELLGHALRPIRSDESKITSAETSSKTSVDIDVTSPSFVNGQSMPVKFTMDGDNLFPGIAWKNLPINTESILLVIEDPDIPKDKPFIHGIVYNIPPDIESLPIQAFTKEGAIDSNFETVGIKCGGNSIGQAKYMSPSPPPGHGPHHYFFQVFALDRKLEFGDMPKLPDIKEAIAYHVLAYGETIGIYERGS